MVKVSALDVPPPGAGFRTVTLAVPAFAISAAWILAVTCPLFTKVVVRAAPFHMTEHPETKFEPFTVKVKALPPCVALGGDSETKPGSGLSGTTLTLSVALVLFPIGSTAEAVMVRLPAGPESAGKFAV